MSQDPVVMALRAALSARDDVEIRVALGTRLLDLGQHVEALSEFEAALALQPSNTAALEAAERAAAASGDATKASAYRIARNAHANASASASAPVAPLRPAVVTPDKPVPASGPHAEAPPPSAAAGKLRLVTDADVAELEIRQRVTFADIGGLDDLKKRLTRSFLLPLRQPELFAKFGKSMRGGLLLYGPPGCGKTFVARALAGEIGARFFSVALSDVLDMWLGESERKLHEPERVPC